MSAASDRLRVVAHVPGRLRVRAETFRVLPEVAAEVVTAVVEEPGVSSAHASAVTGSILIIYDPRETQLLRLLRRVIQVSGVHGVEVDQRDLEGIERPGARIRGLAASIDERVRSAAGGKIDLRVGLPGGLALLGLGKLVFGKARLPEWYDFVFWSLATFSNFNPPPRAPDNDEAAGHDG